MKQKSHSRSSRNRRKKVS